MWIPEVAVWGDCIMNFADGDGHWFYAWYGWRTEHREDFWIHVPRFQPGHHDIQDMLHK